MGTNDNDDHGDDQPGITTSIIKPCSSMSSMSAVSRRSVRFTENTTDGGNNRGSSKTSKKSSSSSSSSRRRKRGMSKERTSTKDNSNNAKSKSSSHGRNSRSSSKSSSAATDPPSAADSTTDDPADDATADDATADDATADDATADDATADDATTDDAPAVTATAMTAEMTKMTTATTTTKNGIHKQTTTTIAMAATAATTTTTAKETEVAASSKNRTVAAMMTTTTTTPTAAAAAAAAPSSGTRTIPITTSNHKRSTTIPVATTTTEDYDDDDEEEDDSTAFGSDGITTILSLAEGTLGTFATLPTATSSLPNTNTAIETAASTTATNTTSTTTNSTHHHHHHKGDKKNKHRGGNRHSRSTTGNSGSVSSGAAGDGSSGSGSGGGGSKNIMNDEYYKAMEEKLKHEELTQKLLQQNKGGGSGSSSKKSSSSRNNMEGVAACPLPVLEPLPWGENDNEVLHDQVAFWKNCLLDDENRLPKDNVRDLLKTLYTLIRQDATVHRSDRLLREIAKKLEDLKALDLPKLIQLMEAHARAGDLMEGNDVILLTGASGSGKTTTLQFLAGTKFEETEVDGFIHLEPHTFKDPEAENFKTACGREPVTNCLQAVQIPFTNNNNNNENDDEGSTTVVVCDTPGAGVATTVEEELSFRYGMGPAIDRAKRIKPVVVLNQELMGSCFSNLPEILDMMKQDLALKSPRDLKPIDYIFTHYEERHRTRLCQQFASLKHIRGPTPQNGRYQLFDELVNDIIEKSSPRAKLAMPLDDDPQNLLKELWKESFVEEPKEYYYHTPASNTTMKRFQLQLQITLEELRTALSREVYSVALNRMVTLDKLSAWFPQAKEATLLAQEAASRQVKTIWKWMVQEVREANYEQALCRMEQMNDFGLIFPDAQECSKNGHGILWESLVTPMEEKNYCLAMERIGKLHKLSPQFNEASQCVKRALRLLRKKIDSSIHSGYFKDPLALLIPLKGLSNDLPEAGECARNILSRLMELLEETIAKKKYAMALHMIRKFGTLESMYPQVSAMAERGMMLCRKTVETAVAQGDYESALFLVKHMQRLQMEFPQEAGELAHYGLDMFSNTLEVLIRHKDYAKAIPLMKKICDDVPGSVECILKGLCLIKEELTEAIQNRDYVIALDIIYAVNNLAKAVPQADACIEYGFNALEENILRSIEQQEYQSAIDLMEIISLREDEMPLAKECTRVGVEVLKRNVTKAIEKKKYSPALEMIQQLSEKGKKIPEVGECSRRGLEMLRATAEKAIEDKDYKTAIEIITNLSELSLTLPESKACTLTAINTIVQHVTGLRQAVEKTVEEVAQTKDLKVYVAMLLKLKSQIEKVMKSEPLRKLSVQIHYKKNFRTKEDEEGDTNVLFVPQLYTSQAFCSDHIELLAGRIREKLPAFDVNDTCMEDLIRNRKAILSVMIRLKAAHKILQHCPGGDKATSVYTTTFEQFHALVETILTVAEDSFKPPLDMRLFELQAWFLSVLIRGFIKDKIDIDSHERREMEELENRRKVLMLQFEVQVTDALEVLAEQEFFEFKKQDELGKADSIIENQEQQDKNGINNHAKQSKGSDSLRTVTSDALLRVDFSGLDQPRNLLISLCQRTELFKMVAKQRTISEVEEIVKNFDKLAVGCFEPMIKHYEMKYNDILEFAKSGVSLPVVLDRINEFQLEVDKSEADLKVVRSWSPEFANATVLYHQKFLILKKRIELATEKLETTIRSEKDIGFGAFVSNIAKPFVCNGNWYDDVPTSFL